MKKLIGGGLNHTMEGYSELSNGDKFIYTENSYEWVGIKIDEEYSALLRGDNKFILAKVYVNCLSIGTTEISYKSFEELEIALEKSRKVGYKLVE